MQLDRGALVALTGVAAAAWVALALEPDRTAMGMPAFLAGWTLMMAAMMLPSITPLVLLHRRVRGGGRFTVALALGYLLVWTAFGLPAFAAQLASAAAGSAHHQPSNAFASRPTRSAIER